MLVKDLSYRQNGKFNQVTLEGSVFSAVFVLTNGLHKMMQ
jgi:hypothetical protein